MKNSKLAMNQAGVLPELSLAVQLVSETGKKMGVKSTGPHKIKLLSDRVVMGNDYETGKERHEMEYTLEENGEKKTYNVSLKDKQGRLHYLVQRLSEIEEGSEVILECKKRGIKNYIEVRTTDDTTSEEKTTTEATEAPQNEEKQGSDDGYIPIIEDDINPKDIPF